MNSICETNATGKYWFIPNTEKDPLSYKGRGILHREDGPAIEWYYGTKNWYINGKRHREDGPAIETVHFNRIWWYLNDKIIKPSNEMMEKYIKLNPDNISKNYNYPLKIQLLAIDLKPSVIFSIEYPDPKLKELYPKLFALKNSGLI